MKTPKTKRSRTSAAPIRLGQVLRHARQAEEKDMRTMAAEIGIPTMRLLTLEAGHPPEYETLAKILVWLFEPAAPRATPCRGCGACRARF